MVTKVVCYSLFFVATVILISARASAKPFSDEDTGTEYTPKEQ